MSVTVILPSIDPVNTRACLDTMKFVDPTAFAAEMDGAGETSPVFVGNGLDWTEGKPDVRLVVVYNTPERNSGVAGAWNIGLRMMYEHHHSWLVLLSAGVRFGESGGRDFIKTLHGATEFDVFPVGGIGPRVIEAGNDLGWHLLAIHKSVFHKIGYFDENFHPGYFEDRDASVRIQRAYGLNANAPDFQGPLWPKVETDARLDSVAHGILRGGVTVDFLALEDYFTRKWGPNEEYATPFDSGNPITWWPQP